MGEEQSADKPPLTYREQAVEDALDEHDRRISRLEKALLIAMGYVLADQDVLLDAALGLFL
jgi:hypothetical protein